MAKLQKGTKVQQIVTPINGVVEGFQVDQQTGDLLVLITWKDDNGTQSRYFKESELKAV